MDTRDPYGSHWKHPELKWEVMSPYGYNREEERVGQVISTLSLIVLKKAGYDVDVEEGKYPSPSDFESSGKVSDATPRRFCSFCM